LHYLVEYMEEKDIAILEMEEELEGLKYGSKELLQSVQQDVKDMQEKLKGLEFTLKNYKPDEPGDIFQETMSSFVGTDAQKLTALSTAVASTRQLFNTVSNFFGEDGEQEDFVTILAGFLKMLEKAWVDVVFAREEAARKAKQGGLKKSRSQVLKDSTGASDNEDKTEDTEGTTEGNTSNDDTFDLNSSSSSITNSMVLSESADTPRSNTESKEDKKEGSKNNSTNSSVAASSRAGEGGSSNSAKDNSVRRLTLASLQALSADGSDSINSAPTTPSSANLADDEEPKEEDKKHRHHKHHHKRDKDNRDPDRKSSSRRELKPGGEKDIKEKKTIKRAISRSDID